MLYYLHGYQSSPTSTKGVLFTKKLSAKAIQYRENNPDELVIADCLKKISHEIQNDHEVVLIGSSLGGFLAATTTFTHPVKQLILLNPAVIPPTTPLESINDILQRILKEMIDPRLFQQKLQTKIDILVGTEDTVVPQEWIMRFATVQEATVHFYHDDHRFSNYLQQLPTIIKTILHEKK
jgi:predicted esterase YcpF (UPF0227 family)